MKIICDVNTVNRAQSNLRTKSQNATLAIGVHPPGNKENSQLFIIVFTKQNKVGTRYKVKDNLAKVFTRFLEEGKITISFKIPEHDLQIQCDKIQLKGFLQVMKLGLENKANVQQLSTLAIAAKTVAPTKLVITKRSEYPIKGFIRTITSLSINGLGVSKVDSQILFLKNLTILNLSNNNITAVPKEIGNLSLLEIDFSANSLGLCKDWKWLDGENLVKHLKVLNLSNNNLSFFIYNIINLQKLITLRMSHNNIKKLPFGIRKMTALRNLFLAQNHLTSVPENLNLIRFDLIDLSGNTFLNKTHSPSDIRDNVKPSVFQLWELAGRVVVQKCIPYSKAIIPKIMVDVLDQAPVCNCGLICYSAKVYDCIKPMQFKANQLVKNHNENIYCDSVFCSLKCVFLQRNFVL